ncbi:MAG: hypothetical protein JEY94_04320 [Melioribacteraceae bacterium]|nr:hypothetical protein [Melioribacteraceae bacterium]
MVLSVLNDLISTTSQIKSTNFDHNNTVVKSASKINAVESKDSARISKLSQGLFNSGLDTNSSKIGIGTSEISFSLEFFKKNNASLTADGLFAQQERSLAVNFNYIFEREKKEDDKTLIKKYEVNFGMNYNDVDSSAFKVEIEKDDIHNFIQQIVDDVVKAVGEEKLSVVGLLLHKDDLMDILGVDDGKGKKILAELIGLIVMAADLKKMTNKNSDAEDVVLEPERKESLLLSMEKSKQKSLDYFMEIREIDSKEVKDSESEKSGDSSTNTENLLEDSVE